MLTEEQKNHSHGLQIDLFSFNLDRSGSPNIPKITNRILSAVLAASWSCELLHLNTRRNCRKNPIR